MLVGGHLDSWHSAPGATDNADGAAVVMEAARILKALGAAPKRTIRFALWSGEEEGLLGSKAYVAQHLEGAGQRGRARQVRRLLQHRSRRRAGLRLLPAGPGERRRRSSTPGSSRSSRWARARTWSSGSATPIISASPRSGLPGFNPIQDYVNYDVRTHHTNMDTPERVREADLRQAAIVFASFAWQAATRDAKIPRPPAPAASR